jgi:hypothetical protein
VEPGLDLSAIRLSGIVGAFIGNWLLPKLGIHLGACIVGAIVNATIGAVVLLLIVRLVRGGTGRSIADFAWNSVRWRTMAAF